MSAAYETFRDLHRGIFVMPNPWDATSTLLLAREGFAALAPTSAGLAFGLGLPDGAAALDRGLSIEQAAMIARLSGLSVNGDLEDGLGPTPEDCVTTVQASIAAGLAGLAIEDMTADP